VYIFAQSIDTSHLVYAFVAGTRQSLSLGSHSVVLLALVGSLGL